MTFKSTLGSVSAASRFQVSKSTRFPTNTSACELMRLLPRLPAWVTKVVSTKGETSTSRSRLSKEVSCGSLNLRYSKSALLCWAR